ncbi:FAD binding domain-containing protein [Paradesulfitobacterium ferrireducens]|uniref:FAD binding domain-containing protein n=1 Tax=Paradesulfitobacterium ferrireducens TaxID=2816476 RepID=UPI001A8D98B0|nr:xanthine dehydrogenase family protein subunit M [Paradesulfitobacterium ferrireducens]
MQSFEFVVPSSLNEVCTLLAAEGDACKVVAGGTDIVPALRENKLVGVTKLIDIRRRPELRGIKRTHHGLWIGAATTHSEIVNSPQVQSQWSLLAEACRQVGSKQIRNLATLGGNVANASPAADSIPALLCLDAKVSLLSTRGKRQVALQDYLQEKKLASKGWELIEGFVLPEPLPNILTKFIKVARRQAMAISRLSLAVVIQLQGDQIHYARLVPGAMLSVTHRLESVEKYLMGEKLSPELSASAAKLACESVIAETGMRPSFAYKLPVLEGLIKKVLDQFQEEVTHG